MTTTGHQRAGPIAWVGLALLTIPVFMTAIDMTALFLATPTIAAELEPTATQQLWMLHIGDLVGAGLVLTAGRMVDRFGPRLLLVLSAVAYGGANLLAAYAPSIEVLVAARALIGFAAISLAPAGMALLRRMFISPTQFSRAVAIFMAAFSGGMAFGPPIGGVLLEYFWWGSIFLVNVPIALLVVLGARVLPRVPGTGTGRIDFPSVLLSLAAIALVVYGGQELAGGAAWPQLGMVAAGLVLGVLFIRRQRRLAEPLLDPALFTSRPIAIGVLAILLVIVATAGAGLQFAQHLQVVFNQSPLAAGLLLTVPAALAIVATVAAPSLLRWARPSVVMGSGVLIAVGGALLMTALLQGGTAVPLGAALLAETIVTVGAAPVYALGVTIIVSNAPVDQAGSAQASADVSGSLGNTMGLAAGGTLAFISYQSRLADTLPAGLDEAARNLSMQSIGSALATAQSLPGELGLELQAAATEAFAFATRNTYGFAAVGLGLLAALILWGLRDARIDPAADVVESHPEEAGGDPNGAKEPAENWQPMPENAPASNGQRAAATEVPSAAAVTSAADPLTAGEPDQHSDRSEHPRGAVGHP